MQCECGKISTILVENEDGTVTPKCESCYLDPKYEDSEDPKKCTHPVKYKKIICEACGEQLSPSSDRYDPTCTNCGDPLTSDELICSDCKKGSIHTGGKQQTK